MNASAFVTPNAHESGNCPITIAMTASEASRIIEAFRVCDAHTRKVDCTPPSHRARHVIRALYRAMEQYPEQCTVELENAQAASPNENSGAHSHISIAAERIYRIANFAPEDRDFPLTAMDQPGLQEIAEELERFAREQDRDIRHACAEAVLAANPRDSAHDHPLVQECFNRAHAACMNAQTI